MKVFPRDQGKVADGITAAQDHTSKKLWSQSPQSCFLQAISKTSAPNKNWWRFPSQFIVGDSHPTPSHPLPEHERNMQLLNCSQSQSLSSFLPCSRRLPSCAMLPDVAIVASRDSGNGEPPVLPPPNGGRTHGVDECIFGRVHSTWSKDLSKLPKQPTKHGHVFEAVVIPV